MANWESSDSRSRGFRAPERVPIWGFMIQETNLFLEPEISKMVLILGPKWTHSVYLFLAHLFKNDFGSLFSSWWRQFNLKKHLWNQKEVGGFNHLEVFSLICLCFISIVQSFFHRVASTLYLVLQYADHLLCHVQWPTGHQAKSEVMLSCQLAKFLALFITVVTMVQLHTFEDQRLILYHLGSYLAELHKDNKAALLNCGIKW